MRPLRDWRFKSSWVRSTESEQENVYYHRKVFSRCEGICREDHSKVVLVDVRQLAALVIDFNVDLSAATAYELKKVNSDYFVEEQS
jgi:restriction endonuclease Mrr